MLAKIQKELVQKKTRQMQLLIESDISNYRKLKNEYEKLPKTKQQNLSNEFKVYLLWAAAGYDDIAFADTLILTHDYEKIETVDEKRTLGRFYEKFSMTKKIIDHFLPLFNQEKLDINDTLTLFKNLYKRAMHQDCQRVIQYAQNNYSENLAWNLEILKYQIDTQHIYPAHKDIVLPNLKYLYPKCTTASEYLQIAICFYSAGYFNDSLNMLDAALQRVIPNVNYMEKNLFNSTQCLESMNEIIDILANINIKAFPVGGSLLGLVRDGKFMDFDKDADIGIFVNNYDDIFKIVSTICQVPKFIAPGMVNNPKEAHLWNVGIEDTERSSAVDLFFYYKQSTHIENGIYTGCGMLKWSFTPFELVEQTLAGKKYWTPDNTSQYLTDLYGNWKIPVKIWDSLVDCPNLMESSQSIIIYYGLTRFYESLSKNKIEKSLNYYKKLTEKWGIAFSPKTDVHIKKLLKI